MGRELAVPYVSSGEAIESLASVGADGQMSSVAINIDGHFLSINYLDLRPGDILLFDAGKPDPLYINPVQKFQTQIFGPNSEIAKWRHVGILGSNYQVWDAMPNLNVRSRPLREVLLETARVGVFRPKRTVDPARLGVAVLEFSRGQYRIFDIDTGGALLARLMARSQGKKAVSKLNPKKVICSVFVTNVLRFTTGFNFFKSLSIAIPADFAVDPEFERVDLQWCRLIVPPSHPLPAPAQPLSP